MAAMRSARREYLRELLEGLDVAAGDRLLRELGRLHENRRLGD